MNARYSAMALGAVIFVGSIGYAATSAMFLNDAGPSAAPFAHTRFCLRYPAECKVTGTDTGEKIDTAKNLKLSPDRRAQLETVNTKVNREIIAQPQNDPPAAEQWVIKPAEGDCNDYAVTKRHDLIERGWPSDALLLTEVSLKSGEHHLVLVARTNEGDLILDNLHQTIRTVAEANTDYKWVRMESERNPLYWSKVRLPS